MHRILATGLLTGLLLAISAGAFWARADQTIDPDHGDSTMFSNTYPQLRWRYYLPGDFNQDGEVNSADLVPLSQHLHETVPSGTPGGTGFPAASLQAVLDADGNGEINLADITAMGRNFHRNALGGFRLYAQPLVLGGNPGTSVTLGTVNFADTTSIAPLGERKLYTFTVPGSAAVGPDFAFYAQPLDSAGNPSSDAQQLLVPCPPTTGGDLNGLRYDTTGGTSVLRWLYFSQADANEDGMLDLSDVTGVSKDFHKMWTTSDDSFLSTAVCSDGNLDGEVNLTDLQMVALLYGRNVAGYRIYFASDLSQYPASALSPSTATLLGNVDLIVSGLGNQRRALNFALPASPQAGYYWVRPYGLGNLEGAASTAIQLP